MKRLVVILSIFLVVFASCEDNEEETSFTESGLVVDYGSSGDCGYVIELENGNKILPLYYPEDFTFTNGQLVLVEYVELNTVHTSCDYGIACEIKYIEELACAAYVDVYSENYDSLTFDPVYLHEAYVDESCLYFKISYSGGCEDHSIDLARIQPDTTSSSTVPFFEIMHNANNDLCEAYYTKKFRFDLSPLINEGKTEFVLAAKLIDGETYNKVFNFEQN